MFPVEGLLTGDYVVLTLKEIADSTILCSIDVKSIVLAHVGLRMNMYF